MLDDGHSLLVVRAEALADALLVVVLAPAGLAALEEPLRHLVLGGREEEHHARLADVLVELERLVHLAREAVDEEAAAAVAPAVAAAARGVLERGAHRVLEQLDRDLHRHDLALADVGADHLAVLGARPGLLGAQEVAR